MKVQVLEPFHLSNSGKPEISKIFSQGKYFIQNNLEKNQKFYEFILIDTDYVEISHIQNQTSIDICYSKCKICKVISQKSWGQSPDTHKMFSQNFRLKSYDYHDYIDTWYHTFFFRPFDHSWFFHWGDEIKNQTDFPNWFQEWWLFFGAIKHIFCPQILEGYKYFSKHGSHWFRLPVHKYYFSFQDFKFLGFLVGTLFSQMIPASFHVHLARELKVKWWSNFSHLATQQIPHIHQWISSKNSLSKPFFFKGFSSSSS